MIYFINFFLDKDVLHKTFTISKTSTTFNIQIKQKHCGNKINCNQSITAT